MRQLTNNWIITLLGAAMLTVLVLPLRADADTVTLKASRKEMNERTYKLSQSKDVVLNLLGTTPVRDWKMTANNLTGEATMTIIDNQLLEIRALTFSLAVKNLRADVKAMEEDAYEALKADRHKEITFELAQSTITVENSSAYLVTAQGKLTVAGVTRNVTLRMHALIARDGSISFSGTQLLRMSDYDVERPSLLFGAIKASNDMTLNYRLIFTK